MMFIMMLIMLMDNDEKEYINKKNNIMCLLVSVIFGTNNVNQLNDGFYSLRSYGCFYNHHHHFDD